MNATLPPPTITTGCRQILDALTLWLHAQGLSHTLENAVFAEDGDIEYTYRRVLAAHVQTLPQFEPRLTRLLAGGPDWVHANLLSLSDGRVLVTVAVGTPVGNPRPALNLSHELGHPLTVVGQNMSHL